MNKCLPCELHKVTWRPLAEVVKEARDFLEKETAKISSLSEEEYDRQWAAVDKDYYAMNKKEGILEGCEEAHTGLEDGTYEILNVEGMQYIRKIK